MRTDTFLKIATHIHTGAGDGSQLGTGSLLANAVTGAKFRLDNLEFLRARNAADSADIPILKVDASDKVEINVSTIVNIDSASLSDNNAVASTSNMLTLASNEAVSIKYKIIRGTDVQSGELELEQSNSTVVDSFSGDDTGITFSLVADVLSYVSTSTGNTATITYRISKL